ncbi:hypothetical protein PV11_06357 [Exophiala sideris]|uniref:Uncharacterized protein n=1 Tax=Exophiala sideris TaxID=1016849 RepID=A0A0D1YD54_9EURO|nr:hypothetical protein PV11_06357 [Exophiala sideris]
MFSLSSPPQPSTFFAANRPHFVSHAPQTPSPLRTWRNANLMPIPTPSSKTNSDAGENELPSSPLRSSPLGKYADENARPEKTSGNIQGAGFGFCHAGNSMLMTPPHTTETPSASRFELGSGVFGEQQRQESQTPLQMQQQQQHIPGPWESRARSASPAAVLARHSASAREKKKNQFFDRIRRRRDDERSDGMGEQVLRLDFVRERRMWEDEMRRRAVVEGDNGLDPDSQMEDEAQADDQAEMSPTEEFDPEADALAYQYQEGDEFLVDEDDEYDEVFREIMLAEEHGASTNTRPGEAVHEYEAGMDLS